MDAQVAALHLPHEVSLAVLGTQEAEHGRERRGRRAVRELLAARQQEAEEEERHAHSIDEDGDHRRRNRGLVRGGCRHPSHPSLLSPRAAAQRVVGAQPEFAVVKALTVEGLQRNSETDALCYLLTHKVSCSY